MATSQYRTYPKTRENPHFASSYRPIALISVIRKIFEDIIKKRLEHYLESNSILPSFQYGFRKGLSTQDCVLDLWSHLHLASNSNQHSMVAFLDIQGAFDHVLPNILLPKLEQADIPQKFFI